MEERREISRSIWIKNTAIYARGWQEWSVVTEHIREDIGIAERERKEGLMVKKRREIDGPIRSTRGHAGEQNRSLKGLPVVIMKRPPRRNLYDSEQWCPSGTQHRRGENELWKDRYMIATFQLGCVKEYCLNYVFVCRLIFGVKPNRVTQDIPNTERLWYSQSLILRAKSINAVYVTCNGDLGREHSH